MMLTEMTHQLKMSIGRCTHQRVIALVLREHSEKYNIECTQQGHIRNDRLYERNSLAPGMIRTAKLSVAIQLRTFISDFIQKQKCELVYIHQQEVKSGAKWETEVTAGHMHGRGLHSELNIHWSMTATENTHLTLHRVDVRRQKVSAWNFVLEPHLVPLLGVELVSADQPVKEGYVP